MPGTQPETWQDFHFPKCGIDTAGPFGRQPVRQDTEGNYSRTSVLGTNVRTFETLTLRDRGGSREGLTQYVPQQVPILFSPGTPWIVQNINTLLNSTGNLPLVQQNISGYVAYLIAVSQGNVAVCTPGDTTWTQTVNNSGENVPLNITGLVFSSPNNQKMYFCDGTNYVYYDPSNNSVNQWSASSGSMPRDSSNNGARLITTWRGRTILSGLELDPQNWFMSASTDPTNWNYNPVPNTVTQAVAGNNSSLGLIGDIITGMVPYTDDLLIFFGEHTIYAMKGDPADSGKIDLVSDVTGAAFGQAWCKDPYGNVYFFGNRPGVWMMAGAQVPQRISQPIEPLIAGIDTGQSAISMCWDDRFQAVHIWITPVSEPTSTNHYVWEFRSNSWWQDQYANNNHNPLSAVAYNGNTANDRAVLIGSWDGYVRFLDPSNSTDDGTAITSSVLIGPIMTQQLDKMLLKDLQFVMAESSGQVTWNILAGATAEAAVTAAARATGTAIAGRNPNRGVRVADHAIYIQITSTNRWAMEAIRTRFQGKGKVARRTPN